VYDLERVLQFDSAYLIVSLKSDYLFHFIGSLADLDQIEFGVEWIGFECIGFD
jgi:hypothetical protein